MGYDRRKSLLKDGQWRNEDSKLLKKAKLSTRIQGGSGLEPENFPVCTLEVCDAGKNEFFCFREFDKDPLIRVRGVLELVEDWQSPALSDENCHCYGQKWNSHFSPPLGPPEEPVL